MKNFKRDSRGFVIHNFRNIGVYNNNSSERDQEGAFLRLSSLESPGGLVIILGENNTGKSNALAALEEFGKGEKGNLHNNKPNFLEYEDSLPQLELSYRIYGQQESEHENVNDFKGKTFNVTFTDKSKAKGMEIEGLDEESYKTLIQEKIDNSKVFVLYDIDINRQKPQKEIRLILPESNRVLFCSPTLGGKSLQCFSTVEKDYKSIKNLNKAIPLSCRFMIEDASQTNDDAKELREYLKELYGDKNSNRHSQTLSHVFYKAISYVDKKKTCCKYSPEQIKQKRDMEAICNELVSKYRLIKEHGLDRYFNGDINEWLNQLKKHQNDFEALKKLYSDLENVCKKYLKHYSSPKIDFIDLDSIPLRTYSMAPDIGLGDMSFIPNIILYREIPLGNEDLVTTPIDISNFNFFQSLFKAIDYNPKTIEDAYKKYDEKHNSAHYTSAAKHITKKLKHINQRFNNLYNKDDEMYRFELHCENNQISLEIYKNNQALNLDEQSVGFRKFFDFFFNFLHTGKVGKGDIVLIDEAETHLSVPAQRDFRAFLKDFGQKTGILFVITTHSPFMLDMNHLDEIRILKSKKDGIGVEIINEFSFVGSDEVDTLSAIKTALGVDYFSIVNPKRKPIFVEGITDYHYLNAFALLYEKEKNKTLDLIFLPIGGLGEIEKQSQKLKSLIEFSNKLRISPATLLVDNDKAGQVVKNEAEKDFKDDLKVIVLSEVEVLKDKFPEDFEIEDIFTEKDRETFGINEKDSLLSHFFKNCISELKIQQDTKDSFYQLLDYLETC